MAIEAIAIEAIVTCDVLSAVPVDLRLPCLLNRVATMLADALDRRGLSKLEHAARRMRVVRRLVKDYHVLVWAAH